jgi:hypothetical protein
LNELFEKFGALRGVAKYVQWRRVHDDTTAIRDHGHNDSCLAALCGQSNGCLPGKTFVRSSRTVTHSIQLNLPVLRIIVQTASGHKAQRFFNGISLRQVIFRQDMRAVVGEVSSNQGEDVGVGFDRVHLVEDISDLLHIDGGSDDILLFL